MPAARGPLERPRARKQGLRRARTRAAHSRVNARPQPRRDPRVTQRFEGRETRPRRRRSGGGAGGEPYQKKTNDRTTTFLRHGASAGAVGSMLEVWNDQRDTEPSVTES